MFKHYFLEERGYEHLSNIEATAEDGDQKTLRKWVRNKWPRRVSKLTGNQDFEYAFSLD